MREGVIHFVEAIVYDRRSWQAAEARLVMDVYVAADLSDELGEPVTLPEMIRANRTSKGRIQTGAFDGLSTGPRDE